MERCIESVAQCCLQLHSTISIGMIGNLWKKADFFLLSEQQPKILAARKLFII